MGMTEHAGVVAPLLYLPVAIAAGALAVELAARAGSAGARRLRSMLLAAPPAAALAALLMAVSAVVHLAIVPAHTDEPVTAVLFVLDGAALAVMAVAVMLVRRPMVARASTALLAAGGAAYAIYLLAGIETADAVGLITKVVELAAIGLLIQPIPQRRLSIS